MLAYGIDPKIIMAELTGREAGISHGKGGSMHMFSTEHAFYGGAACAQVEVSEGGDAVAQWPRAADAVLDDAAGASDGEGRLDGVPLDAHCL